MPSRSDSIIRAAGGVLLRKGPNGVELVLVHRPKWDDWVLPKGKANPGETLEECALREVREETACSARLIRPIGTTEYPFKGKTKQVSYWLMEVDEESEFHSNEEIDRIIWLSPSAAVTAMSHKAERRLVREALH